MNRTLKRTIIAGILTAVVITFPLILSIFIYVLINALWPLIVVAILATIVLSVLSAYGWDDGPIMKWTMEKEEKE
jgi:hypothetical protein